MAEEKKIGETVKLEDAMKRLDQVVSALDRETLDLEQGLKLYEEGVHLVRICNERLQEAERTVRVLKMSGDGEIVEEAFDGE